MNFLKMLELMNEMSQIPQKVFCSELIRQELIKMTKEKSAEQTLLPSGMPVEVSSLLFQDEWFVIDGKGRVVFASKGLNITKAQAIVQSSLSLQLNRRLDG